jgi:hypothetical protein
MNSVLKVVKSALKLLILWWVMVYDKYKTALMSDPSHWIALVDFLLPLKAGENQLVRSGGSDRGRRKSTRAIRWLGSDTRAVFLFYRPAKQDTAFSTCSSERLEATGPTSCS